MLPFLPFPKKESELLTVVYGSCYDDVPSEKFALVW